MKQKKDVILILEGGAMAGVFSAGVVSALDKANIHERVESIYSASAGAHSGAYFLSKETLKGTEIYTEDLLSKRYAFVKKLSIKDIVKKVFNLLIFRKHMHLMDLEVLKKIQRTRRKINIQKIKSSSINFYVKVFDTKNLVIRYLDGKKNVIEAISVSSHCAPYIYQKTRHTHYYDGELVPNNDFIRIIKENPDKKIIYILNERRTRWYSFVDLPIQIAHFIFISRYFGLDFASYYLVHFFDKPNIENIRKHKNVFVVYPNINIRKITTDKRKLKKVYRLGFNKGLSVLKSLGYDTKKISI